MLYRNCCFITTCKARSKVAHTKQKYFHDAKGRGYRPIIRTVYYISSTALEVRKIFLLFCMRHFALLWALHFVIKQQFFYIYLRHSVEGE